VIPLNAIFEDSDKRKKGRTFKVVDILEDEVEVEVLTDHENIKTPTVGRRFFVHIDRLDSRHYKHVGQTRPNLKIRCSQCKGPLFGKSSEDHRFSGDCRVERRKHSQENRTTKDQMSKGGPVDGFNLYAN
jgi:hypothetical protein